MSLQQIDSAARRGIEQLQHAVQQAPMLTRNVQVTDMVEPMYWAFTFSAILLMCGIVRSFRKSRGGSVLDRKLFQLNRDNWMGMRDLVANIHAAGGTGSGKTSSFRQIARAILQQDTSMLVLCAKRDEYLDWLRLVKETGRSRDVILIDPDHANYLNMLGTVASGIADPATKAQEVTQFLMTLREVVFRQVNQGGGDSQYWKQQDERAIKSGATILALAREQINASNLSQLILTAPQSVEQRRTNEWKQSYCSQCIVRAMAAANTPDLQHDFEKAAGYFTHEWPVLADRTRGSVLMGVMSTLDVLNSGLAFRMFGNESTFSIEKAIASGKVAIVNLPPDVHGDLGRLGSWSQAPMAEGNSSSQGHQQDAR